MGSEMCIRDRYNEISSWGALLTGISVIFFFVWVFEALIVRRKAPDNYWGEGANTLEWTLSSPPPYHQFNTLPVFKDEDHH